MPINDKKKYCKKSYTHPGRKIKPDRFSSFLIDDLLSLVSGPHHPPQKKLFSELIEIGKKGANLELICKTIDFFPGWNETKDEELEPPSGEEYNRRVKKLGNKKKAVNGAVGQIKKLKPLKNPGSLEKIDLLPREFHIALLQRIARIDSINSELAAIQSSLPVIINRYFRELESRTYHYSLLDILKSKKGHIKALKNVNSRKRSSQRLNERIIIIVDELIRIGYANQTAYKITGKLLHLSYPTHFPDPDPDIVRQRYKYHLCKKSK